ncbi:MAG: hypothetical protein PVF15_03705 [Candidatus Bathyarchaeota archaeon]
MKRLKRIKKLKRDIVVHEECNIYKSTIEIYACAGERENYENV